MFALKQGPGPPHWDLKKNTIFSGFLPLNYAIRNFQVCFFFKLSAMWRTEEACMMIKSLHMVDCLHYRYLLAIIEEPNYRAPLRKILGAFLP